MPPSDRTPCADSYASMRDFEGVVGRRTDACVLVEVDGSIREEHVGGESKTRSKQGSPRLYLYMMWHDSNHTCARSSMVILSRRRRRGQADV